MQPSRTNMLHVEEFLPNHGAANSRSTCSPRLRQRVNLKFKSAASARGFTYA